MEQLTIYTATKQFNPLYNIQLVACKTGSITLTLLTHEGGTVICTLGTLAAGESKALTQGRATIGITVSGSTEYCIA
jgi:hypothetical protein